MHGKSAFQKLLHSILARGGVFIDDMSRDLDNNSVYLRHDIDFSLERALEVAKLEAAMGVTANFFFMLSSNFYNLVAEESTRLVKEITQLGHKVSLHFDPSIYDDIDAGMDHERAIFESIFDVKVTFVSLHRPGVFLEDNNRRLPGVRHTYEDEFFKEIAYASDSAGSFDVNRLDVINSGPLQLLLHPIWWTQASASPTETLTGWLREHEHFLRKEISKNCRAYIDVEGEK